MNKKRTFFFRALAIALLLVVAAIMLVIGRGHTVYFDNRKMEYEGVEYKAPYKVEVYVKDERVAKLYDKERGMASWMGQNFKMVMEVTQEKGGEAESWEIGLKLPYNMDGIIINIPTLLEGLPEEAYLSEFVQTVVEETEEETTGEGLEGMEGLGDI